MRNLLMTCASAVLLASLAPGGSAAERPGAVSKSTLDEMGLSNVQLISDGDGLAVRGMGTRVRVFGPTYDVTRTHFARRSNFSISGGSFSGGGSSAFAR